MVSRALGAWAAGYVSKGRDWLPDRTTLHNLRALSSALAAQFPPTGELEPGPLVRDGEEYEWVEAEAGDRRHPKTMIKVYPAGKPMRAAKLYVETNAGMIVDALGGVVLDMPSVSPAKLKKIAVELLANSVVRLAGTLTFDTTPYTKPVAVSVPESKGSPRRTSRPASRPDLPTDMASPKCCGDFTMSSKDLGRVLRVFSSVIGPREAHPLGRNVVLVASPGAVGVAGWGSGWNEGPDKPQGWTLVGVSLPAKVATPGAVAVSVKELLAALKTAPAEVRIEAMTEATARVGAQFVATDGVTVASYREMPKRAWREVATITAGALSGLLERTTYAMSTDDTRPQLAALKLEATGGKGEIRAIATDGHRLVTSLAPARIAADVSAVVSRQVITVLESLVSQSHPDAVVRIGMSSDSKGEIAFDFPGGFARGTLIPEGFPSWEQVFPTKTKQTDRKITVNRGQLVSALNAINDAVKAFGVELLTDKGDSLALVGHGERVTAPVTIQARTKGDKRPMRVGVRELYLREMASSITGDEIVLGFSDPLDPIVVESAETRAVIMPMRV
jgi:DNA polymerase-3 subunit beta